MGEEGAPYSDLADHEDGIALREDDKVAEAQLDLEVALLQLLLDPVLVLDHGVDEDVELDEEVGQERLDELEVLRLEATDELVGLLLVDGRLDLDLSQLTVEDGRRELVGDDQPAQDERSWRINGMARSRQRESMSLNPKERILKSKKDGERGRREKRRGNEDARGLLLGLELVAIQAHQEAAGLHRAKLLL